MRKEIAEYFSQQVAAHDADPATKLNGNDSCYLAAVDTYVKFGDGEGSEILDELDRLEKKKASLAVLDHPLVNPVDPLVIRILNRYPRIS